MGVGKGAVMPEVEKEGTEKEAATRKTLGYPLLWGGEQASRGGPEVLMA